VTVCLAGPEPGRRSCQRGQGTLGQGNSWGEVSGGVHFDQCLLDETNCVKWVDFETLDFAGHATDIVYVGLSGG